MATNESSAGTGQPMGSTSVSPRGLWFPLFASGVSTLVLLAMLAYLPKPPSSYFWTRLYDTGHIFLFGLMTLPILSTAGVVLQTWRRRYHYLVAILFTFAVGVAAEVVQEFSGRTAQFIDVYSDLVGILAFAAMFAIFDRHLTGFRGGMFRRGRLAVVAVSLIFAGVFPMLDVWRMYTTRNAIFPIILDFQQPWYRKLYSVSFCRISLVPPPPMWPPDVKRPRVVGRFDAAPGPYPGLHLMEPVPDWRGYQYLEVDVFLDAAQSREFVLRVHDQSHNNDVRDRFRRPFVLSPGFHTMRVDLDDVEHGPRERVLQMDKISGVGIYTPQLKESFRFYVGEIRLAKPRTP